LEIEKAVEIINQGLSLAKSNGNLEMLLGDIEIIKGDKEKALQIWDKIVSDNICDDTGILASLGERFIANGRDETGIMLFNKSHEVDTDNLSALFSLAFYYDGKGDEEKAIESWERIIYATNHHTYIDDEDKAKHNIWPKDMIKHLRERQKNKK
jgi:lipopolysaccharide biosynthesis regulator YciM